MPPVPCRHCGVNFMPHLPTSEDKLCNNCSLKLMRDKQEKNLKEFMSGIIEIIIKCPFEDQKVIEEACMNQGIDFSKYFMGLHYEKQNSPKVTEKFKECKEKVEKEDEQFEFPILSNKHKKGSKK